MLLSVVLVATVSGTVMDILANNWRGPPPELWPSTGTSGRGIIDRSHILVMEVVMDLINNY